MDATLEIRTYIRDLSQKNVIVKHKDCDIFEDRVKVTKRHDGLIFTRAGLDDRKSIKLHTPYNGYSHTTMSLTELDAGDYYLDEDNSDGDTLVFVRE